MPKKDRLDYIFQNLSNGVPSAALITRLERQTTKSQLAVERGNKSEKRVIKVLGSVEVVTKVTRVSNQKGYDQNGIDALAETEIPWVGTIKIQVKSSTVGIDTAKAELQTSQYLSTVQELNDWLCKHRRIFLDGNLTEQSIAQSFKRQALAIYQFQARSRNQNPDSWWVDKLR